MLFRRKIALSKSSRASRALPCPGPVVFVDEAFAPRADYAHQENMWLIAAMQNTARRIAPWASLQVSRETLWSRRKLRCIALRSL